MRFTSEVEFESEHRADDYHEHVKAEEEHEIFATFACLFLLAELIRFGHSNDEIANGGYDQVNHPSLGSLSGSQPISEEFSTACSVLIALIFYELALDIRLRLSPKFSEELERIPRYLLFTLNSICSHGLAHVRRKHLWSVVTVTVRSKLELHVSIASCLSLCTGKT